MISASLMCGDLLNLEKEIRELENGDVDYLHLDIMDGCFVPNYTFGTDVIKQIRRITDIPLDIHLMVERPEDKLNYFDIQAKDIVSVNVEATRHISRILQEIRKRGALAGVAVNPGSSIESVYSALLESDILLIMTVNPGFAGQELVEHTLSKIEQAKMYTQRKNLSHIKISVDGNVSFENAKEMKKRGAEIFIAGSSSIFKTGISREEGIRQLKKAII